MKWIIAIILNIVIILAQKDQLCVLPSTSTITIGLKNYLCAKLIFQDQVFVYSFPITVDKVSVLSLNDVSSVLLNSSSQTNSTHEVITLKLQFQNSKETTELLLSNKQLALYRNLISVVIKVNGGIFSAIINDSQDCDSCHVGANVCHEDQCFNTGYFLQQSNFYIYVSWVGTDLKQQHLVSYTQRLNKLSKFSFANIFTQAFSIY